MPTFDSTKHSLPDLLKEISLGKIQLPDFQRGWVWDDEHVRSLLISIARSFPVGAVMLLEVGGEAKFQVRPVEGTEEAVSQEAERLILDGQQRLTSLSQVLSSTKPVKTRNEKGRPLERFYYIDINTALQGHDRLEDAIIGLDPDKKLKRNFGRDVVLDLSTTEKECQTLHFPCSQILNADDWEESLQTHAPEYFGTYMKFRKEFLNAFRAYQIPVIELKKESSKEAVCLVFEKVNTGGVALSVFELVTATYAADNFNLRDDWFGSPARNVEGKRPRLAVEPTLQSLSATDFLQAVTLLHTLDQHEKDLAAGKSGKQVAAISAKRSAVLSLPLGAYDKYGEAVVDGFLQTARFLRKECFYDPAFLPYRTQIVPLAAVMTHLKERWLEPKINEKLSHWFWCGVMGELYGGAVETRAANDLEDLLAWIAGGGEPRTVTDASFQPGRLETLRSRTSAAYKGLHVLVLRQGSRDFFWKETTQQLDLDEVMLDIHHIFPKKWCETQEISPRVFNSIINKTPISYKANRMIGANAPSKYLAMVQNHKQVQASDEEMNSILRTHLIDPSFLRSDDFEAFMASRKRYLLEAIEKVMGKQVIDGHTVDDDFAEDDLPTVSV